MKVNLFFIRVLLQVELRTNTWEEMEYKRKRTFECYWERQVAVVSGLHAWELICTFHTHLWHMLLSIL